MTGLILSGVGYAGQVQAFVPELVPKLEVVAELDSRPGNVAVGGDGRVFITMHPFDNPKCTLMVVDDTKKVVPYPDEKTSCNPPDQDGKGFYSAIGLRATVRGALNILDLGTKDKLPRIVSFNIGNNQFGSSTEVPKDVLTDQSFLQDFAYDWITNNIVIADMGQADLHGEAKPALIIMYGNPLIEPRRVLGDHPSVQPSASTMKAEGKEVLVKRGDVPTPVKLGLNPITMDPQSGWLYFGPMGAGKIYRVPLNKLYDIHLPPADLAAAVEEYADKPESDGMTIDASGNIYLTSVNGHEIGVIGKDKLYRPYIKDERLVWPDGMSFGPDGYIYVTINQLNRSAALNLGKEVGAKPYLVAKFRPLGETVLGR